MALPQKPQRKSTQVGVNVQGKPVVGANKETYNRKSAQPFGSVSREQVLPRKSAPASPQSMPINDKDAGNWK